MEQPQIQKLAGKIGANRAALVEILVVCNEQLSHTSVLESLKEAISALDDAEEALEDAKPVVQMTHAKLVR